MPQALPGAVLFRSMRAAHLIGVWETRAGGLPIICTCENEPSATPTPPHVWRNRMTPRVATRPQSLQRGRTGGLGKFAAGPPHAQPAWLGNERAVAPSSF